MKWDFEKILGIMVIIGFLGIIYEASFGMNVSHFVSSAFFVIMGVALLVVGGFKLFLKYFEGGLTFDEVTKIITILVGAISILLGLLMLFNFGWNILNGLKIVISFVAVFIIMIEMFKGEFK